MPYNPGPAWDNIAISDGVLSIIKKGEDSMKRKIAMFAALAMLIGSLAGCTSAGGPDAQESTTQGVTTTQAGTDGEKTTAAPEETTQGEWTGEVDHVIMT